jgi:TetR/AcrR family transcriptional regulator, cholesterol catabolism regulator
MRVSDTSNGDAVRSETEVVSTGRERLLATAAVMFRRDGYVKTSTRDLAAALGMQSASLYHYIGGKEDLLFELSTDALGAMLEAGRNALEGLTDPMERVRALMRTHLVTALHDQDKHAVMLIEMKALTPPRRAMVLEMRDQYEAFVGSVLEDARRAGLIRSDIPVKYLKLALLDLLGWTIFWYRPDGELTPEALADIMTTLFLDGAGVGSAPARKRPARRLRPASTPERTFAEAAAVE